MKKSLSLLAAAMLATAVCAADNNPVVMTVAGNDVGLLEFRHYLESNSSVKSEKELDVKDFARMYVDYKMKVQAAVDAGIDTTESFIREYQAYRDYEASNYIIDTAYLETIARRSYEESVREVGEFGLIRIGAISFAPDNESREEMDRCFCLADSIYDAIQNGADFQTLVAKYSTDRYAARGGDMGWHSLSQIPEGILEFIMPLKENECTKPFLDVDRVCILKYMGHRDLGSYEENRAEIYEWMTNNRPLMERSMLNKAKEYSDGSNWGLSDSDSIISYMTDNLETVCPEFGNISREYHDGLLLFEISNREVWNKAQTDEKGLLEFFKSNARHIKFDVPCFKGMVLFCKTEEVFNQIEQALKDRPFEEWSDIIVSFNAEVPQVRAMRGKKENGIFPKGQNDYVDKLVFGEGSFEPRNGYPFTYVVGHVIRRPETLSDNLSEVTELYQEQLEKNWLKTLHRKYKFKINKKILKQVYVE